MHGYGVFAEKTIKKRIATIKAETLRVYNALYFDFSVRSTTRLLTVIN